MELLIEDANNSYGVHPDLWKWDPVVDGPAFGHFLDYEGLPLSARDALRRFTPRVLGQSADPSVPCRSTGLVIGKVQSGKTNSFLALAALASDNGFRVIIILSGTKNILKNQTYKEVVNRLSGGQRGWKAVDFDPSTDQSDFEDRLRRAFSPIVSRTLVVTILKRTRGGDSPQGIDRLASFLETSDYSHELERNPVLIIDDEADEASLDNSANARRQGRAPRTSPTHMAIDRLRGCFDKHFFVQYTATPQANLLVELNDQLAPDFCELLQPGNGYCGAAEFFPPTQRFFREIPQSEVTAVQGGAAEPPESLVQAIQLFYVAAALEDYRAGTGQHPATRSMLVHPDRALTSHTDAQRWVSGVRGRLLDVAVAVGDSLTGPLAADLAATIRESLDELSSTVRVSDIEPEDLFGPLYARLDETSIRCINSERQAAEDIDWEEESCWIFIGGDVLQRGFAVRGLTVTWMARPAGAGQVDVLMQRGRWFGYREPYLPYCRVWMPRDVHDDYYALFADHEQALWRSLGDHLDRGGSLADWSRVFWLDPNPALRLCRRSTQWFRLRQHPEWASQLWIPQQNDAAGIAAAARNEALVSDLIASNSWSQAWIPGQANPNREHDVSEVPLAELSALLDEYEFFGTDVVDRAVVRDAIAVLMEGNPSSLATVVNMRPRASAYRRGQQGEAPRINQLLAGASNRSVSPASPTYYPGDRAFYGGGEGLPTYDEGRLTVQIHRPQIIRRADQVNLTASGGYLAEGCPLLAVFLPESVRQYRREGAGDRS